MNASPLHPKGVRATGTSTHKMNTQHSICNLPLCIIFPQRSAAQESTKIPTSIRTGNSKTPQRRKSEFSASTSAAESTRTPILPSLTAYSTSSYCGPISANFNSTARITNHGVQLQPPAAICGAEYYHSSLVPLCKSSQMSQDPDQLGLIDPVRGLFFRRCSLQHHLSPTRKDPRFEIKRRFLPRKKLGDMDRECGIELEGIARSLWRHRPYISFSRIIHQC